MTERSDQPFVTASAEPGRSPTDALANLPDGVGQAMLRGGAGKCPRCGDAKLFRAFLKPVDACPHCHQDWSHQRADDFPAYMAIIITGHFIALLLAELDHMNLSFGTIATITITVAVAMVLSLLQPAKGAIIAIQWWNGMHGFAPGKNAAHVMTDK